MYNNQRIKKQQRQQQRQRQPAAAVARGRSGSTSSFLPFAIGPNGARKTRAGRRVAIPEELGRRHRFVVLTTSYKINALPSHFHSPYCAYNTPNKPCTTHTNCVYKNQNKN
jgi:hypothetical protein